MSQDGGADLTTYLPRIVREWAATPDQRHRLIEGSLVFADLTGFTSMTERLARLGRRGAEEVSSIISETFSRMLEEAYRAGGSLLKFGGDALLLLFDDDHHERDAAWGAWGIRNALRRGGRFQTPVGQIRLGMTSAISSGPIHVFMVGDDQKELLVAGETVSELMRLERRASTGETLLSAATARCLPPGITDLTGEGEHRLWKRPPEVAVADISNPPPGAPIDRFLPRAVRHRSQTGEATLEHRHIAIGFVGVEGLDSVIARAPEEAAQALSVVVDTTVAAASEQEAWLLATDVAPDGAKLILTAGAPVATGHDEAALLLTLSRLLHLDAPLRLRLGANHGTAFFGDIGPSYRRTLTVMGDTVNTAARLMGAAPPDAILAARSMLDSRRVGFDHRQPFPISLRGKQAPLEVAEVTGPASRARAEATAAIVGRDRELEDFRRLLADLESGRGAVVEVVGAPGSGRSSFLDQALSWSRVPVVRAEATISERSTPYSLLRRLFEEVTGVRPDEPDAQRMLLKHAETHDPDLVADLPFVARALGISGFDESAIGRVDPRFVPAVTATATARMLTAGATEPLVVAIDDLHLADHTSLEVLRPLAGRATRLRWLLCATAVEADEIGWSGAQPHIIELGPLDREAATKLAKSLTESDPLSNHELTQVVTRANGNPLAIREILSARRRGVAVDSLPVAIEGLAAMRIDQLSPSRRRQLETSAVLGAVFDPVVYEDVAGTAATGLTEPEDDILELRDDGRVGFTNPIIREVVYNRLPFSRRIELHRTTAERLAIGDTPVEELADHLVRGELWVEAFGATMRAGAVAEARFANVEAVRWYEAALECGRRMSVAPAVRAEIWSKLGDLRERSGRYGDAHQAFRQAERLTEDVVERSHILIRRARILEQLGSYKSALAALTRARKLAPDRPDVVAAVTARYGGVRFLQGRHEEALTLATRAVEIADDQPTRSARGLALMILDMARAAIGEDVDGSASLEALEIFEESGELARQARVTNNLGMFSFYRGDWNEAARLYSKSRATFERIGDEVNASYGANNLAEIWALQGRYDEAEALFREVSRIWRAADDRYGAAYIEGQMGLIAAYTGRLEEAKTRLTASAARFEELGARAEVQEAGVHLLEVRILGCDSHGAAEIVERFGLSDHRASGPRLMRLGATLAWQEGRPEAPEQVRAALVLARDTGSAIDELRLLELSARARLATADPQRQQELSEELGMVVSPVYPQRPPADQLTNPRGST